MRRTPSRTACSIADAAAVSEALDKIRLLSLTLTADLAAAAGALDEGQPGIARDILTVDCSEVRQLSADISSPRRATPVPKRRRVLFAMPAVPLIGALAMSGAAALSGGDTAPSQSHVQRAAATARPATQPLTRPDQTATTLQRDQPSATSTTVATSAERSKRLSEIQPSPSRSVAKRALDGRRDRNEATALALSRKLTRLLPVPTPKRKRLHPPSGAISHTDLPTPLGNRGLFDGHL